MAETGQFRTAIRQVLLIAACLNASCDESAPPEARQPVTPAAPLAQTINESRLIDLTHPFNADAVYWPTAKSFTLDRVAYGRDANDRWYASNDFAASEHGGTHLDAPIHFAEGRRTSAEIPLEQLIGPACVIDITAKCDADRDYRLFPEDVLSHEADHGPIEKGAVVLVHTGWSRHWLNRTKYLGHDRRGEATDLHFPGISADAARLLVARKIDLVGIDTASLDHGPSSDFAAHRVFNEANIAGLENLTHLDKLPARGATIIALPMKIQDGTGGPCRVIAILPDESEPRP